MASHKEFQVEWTMLDNDCNNWTLQDLQLAAELGKTLLERNEELEKDLKQQQAIIDDQAQEIEFLTKQTNSMKEESATRAKVYEQLESSIYELERTNSQLSRKHEIDKQRIQSLVENIEFLERKCEEMTGTLESLRDENKKSYGGSKMSRSSYFNFGAGSSDEDIQGGYPLYRRRSHSLHDLRDCSSSPDDFDSNNSNSPDLKTSEAEFIETLESRIEELLSAKRKESEKIQQLESQIRLLVQENAGLQQQLSELTSEKDEEITELRKQLLDSSSYTQFQLPPLNESLLSSTTLPFKTSSRRNSHISNSLLDSASGSGSLSNPSLRSFVSLCKRCSTEINLLNLVNSIEVEHDSENYENFLSYDNEDDMEFSSLEHELARATGNVFDNHNHSHNHLNPAYHQHSSFHYHQNHLHYHLNERTCTDTDTGSSSNVSRCKCRNLTTKRKQNRLLFPNPSEIPVDEMDYENSEIFDIFFNQDDKDEVGEEAKENPDDMSNKASCSSEEEEEDEENEDPCLLKDRKPEFPVKSKAKNKVKQKLCSSSSAKMKKFKSSDSCCGSSTSSGCSSAAATYSSTGTGHCTDSSRQSSPVVILSKNSKLELPARIPTDDEEEEDEDNGHNSIIIVDKSNFQSSTATLALRNRKGCDIPSSDQVDGAKGDGQKLLSSQDNNVQIESNPDEKEPAVAAKKRSKLFQTQESTSSSSGYDSETSLTKSGCSTMSSSSFSASFEESLSVEDSGSMISSSSTSSSPIVPEYKQILQNMFSLFNNSKRKYPIPMYPFIQEARRQSSALTQ